MTSIIRAVYQIACHDYTAEQIEAWAPKDVDREMWCSRLKVIEPFVVEHQSQIAGYADIQSDGYINHFFVSDAYPRRGKEAFVNAPPSSGGRQERNNPSYISY